MWCFVGCYEVALKYLRSRLQIRTGNLRRSTRRPKLCSGDKLLIGKFGPFCGRCIRTFKPYWGRCIETPYNPCSHPVRGPKIWRWRISNFAAMESNPTMLVWNFGTAPGKFNIIVGDFLVAVGNVTITIGTAPTSVLCCCPCCHYHRFSLSSLRESTPPLVVEAWFLGRGARAWVIPLMGRHQWLWRCEPPFWNCLSSLWSCL
jgi:hypothetical protein